MNAKAGATGTDSPPLQFVVDCGKQPAGSRFRPAHLRGSHASEPHGIRVRGAGSSRSSKSSSKQALLRDLAKAYPVDQRLQALLDFARALQLPDEAVRRLQKAITELKKV